MCGRFTLRSRLNNVLKEMHVQGEFDWTPRYNIAPTQEIPIVRQNGQRSCALARWGLVPSWAKDPKMGARMINARSETVAETPAFRSAFRKRRCLVLADGYYEWRALGKKKQPYYIRRTDEQPFAFAGLWECWHGSEGPPLETCTVITTAANDLTRPVHDRMPVILDKPGWDTWLAPDSDPMELKDLLRPCPVEGLAVDPVNMVVNNARNDVPECVQVVEV